MVCPPAQTGFNINSVLEEVVNSYSGNVKKIVDRIYYERTGKCVDALMAEKLGDGTPKLEILIRDRPDLNAFRFSRKVEGGKIVGGIAEVNRTGLRLDIVVNGLAKELYGGFHLLVFDYTGSASALTTVDWGEGLSSAYASQFIRHLEENYSYNRRMKDTQSNRDVLGNVPYTWRQADPTAGYMALWYEVMNNSAWKSEVEGSNKVLSTATLQAVKQLFWGFNPATYQGSNNFTDPVKQAVSNVLRERVSPTSARTWFIISLNTP